MIAKLTDEMVQQRLATELPDWSLIAGKLHREFRFRDFVTAFGFMTQAALVAERLNHHPEWINVYQRVVVDLTTHDAGGISERDFTLAKAMDEAARTSGVAKKS